MEFISETLKGFKERFTGGKMKLAQIRYTQLRKTFREELYDKGIYLLPAKTYSIYCDQEKGKANDLIINIVEKFLCKYKAMIKC